MLEITKYSKFHIYLLEKRLTVTFNILRIQTETKKQPPEVFHKKKLFLKISEYSQENTCGGVCF